MALLTNYSTNPELTQGAIIIVAGSNFIFLLYIFFLFLREIVRSDIYILIKNNKLR
jgi:hypothetical protein